MDIGWQYELTIRQNPEFSIGLSTITKDISSYMSQSNNINSNLNLSATLEALQDKVYSNEPDSGSLSDTLGSIFHLLVDTF